MTTCRRYHVNDITFEMWQVKIEMLGSADRIVVLKEQTTIVSDGKNNEAVMARIGMIRKEAEATDSAVRGFLRFQMHTLANAVLYDCFERVPIIKKIK